MPADVPPPEPDCWLHPDVAVDRSPIAGRGLFARAPIPAGTVVSRLGGRLVRTGDYATSTGEPDFRMPCACGSPLCRGTVTGTDWQRPELRERYGRHWVPALLARIDGAGRA